ncbi:hypothetical protein [Pseudolactococcus carnosus]|nr:hypothetical protein [Lactococcus carnosus]MCJ1972537.1 hypothetical protein [Lactococcus carnosus]
MINWKKYAKYLYPIGGIGVIWWAVTSVMSELKLGTIAQNSLPLAIQLACCLIVLVLIVRQSISLWFLSRKIR